MIHDKYDEDDDDDNDFFMQDNPKHGEGASQTECCGESPFIVFSMWPVTIFNQPINHI